MISFCVVLQKPLLRGLSAWIAPFQTGQRGHPSEWRGHYSRLITLFLFCEIGVVQSFRVSQSAMKQ